MHWIKKKLQNWLFKEERDRLESERLELRKDKASYRNKIESEYDDKAILHLIRQKYAGFEPELLLRDQELLSNFEGEEARLAFMRNMKDVIENDDFRTLLEHLYTMQLVETGIQSNSLEELNFGRATVNGIKLIEDELSRYATLYNEHTQQEPDFDEYSII